MLPEQITIKITGILGIGAVVCLERKGKRGLMEHFFMSAVFLIISDKIDTFEFIFFSLLLSYILSTH